MLNIGAQSFACGPIEAESWGLGESQYQVVARQLSPRQPESLTRQSLQQIALNRTLRKLLGNHQTEPGATRRRDIQRGFGAEMQTEELSAQHAANGKHH